jgi:phosphatidylglycerophosphatase A
MAEKPRLAYAVATALGTGYLKPAPGTWGSLVGLIIAVMAHPFTWFIVFGKGWMLGVGKDTPLLSGTLGMMVLLVPSIAIWLALAWWGVRASTEVANTEGIKDPQHVVIDEVSGVQLALILGLAPVWAPATFFNGRTDVCALYGHEYVELEVPPQRLRALPDIRYHQTLPLPAAGAASRRLGHHGGRLDGGCVRCHLLASRVTLSPV